MAIDKVSIFTTEVTIDTRQSHFRHNPITKGPNTTQRYTMTANDIFIEYFPDIQILKFTFNVSKLLFGDNIASTWAIDFNLLTRRINERLNGYLETTETNSQQQGHNLYPHYRNWKVSYIEYCVDFILHTNDLPKYQEVIKKSSPSRRALNDNYYDEGSLYHFSGSELSKSNIKEISYNKLKERESSSSHKHSELRELTSFSSAESILRLEKRLKRAAVRVNNTSVKTSTRQGITTSKTKPNERLFDSFEHSVSFNKQVQVLSHLLSSYHLEQPILTRLGLRGVARTIARKHGRLDKSYRDNLYRSIDYFNGDLKRPPHSEATLSKHKNLILNAGAHYIYSSKNLDALTLEAAFNKLPEYQKENIKLFKDSNIFRDTLFPTAMIHPNSYDDKALDASSSADTATECDVYNSQEDFD